MNLPIFDQTKGNPDNITGEGESIRLSNELRAKPSMPIKNEFGQIIGISNPKWGFDCETAPYSDFTTWLNDGTIKKSKSLFWFVIRIMAWRFPEKHTEIRSNLSENRKLEFDLILSQMKKDIFWVGQCGLQNMVELNPESVLNKKDVRIVKKPNDKFKWVRK